MSKHRDGKYGGGRWVRNKWLAEHFNVSEMTLWRWKRNPALNTPPSSVINNIEYNDLDGWDDWMRNRAVDRTKKRVEKEVA
jgi:hypothetical protein